MKNTLVMFFAVVLMVTGCVPRTYVNRNPYSNSRYGHATYGHHNTHNSGYDHRYDRGW